MRLRRSGLGWRNALHFTPPDECGLQPIAPASRAEVLSEDNRTLLKVICDTKPESIVELAQATGRHPGNLARTLSTMARYGFVELRKKEGTLAKTPVARATDFKILAAA